MNSKLIFAFLLILFGTTIYQISGGDISLIEKTIAASDGSAPN